MGPGGACPPATTCWPGTHDFCRLGPTLPAPVSMAGADPADFDWLGPRLPAAPCWPGSHLPATPSGQVGLFGTRLPSALRVCHLGPRLPVASCQPGPRWRHLSATSGGLLGLFGPRWLFASLRLGSELAARHGRLRACLPTAALRLALLHSHSIASWQVVGRECWPCRLADSAS